MKLLILSLAFCLLQSASFAQKVIYKNNLISVDGKDLAKVEVVKENMGLTKNFTLYALDGTKLVIAVVSTEFAAEMGDNSNLYYRFTFLTTNQVGIFKLPSLGPEKNFAKLIGESAIVDKNELSEAKVSELIAIKGVTPRVLVNYAMVERPRIGAVELRETKQIYESGTNIGFFKYTGQINGVDFYEFFVPEGIMVAKVNFIGGNNAQNCDLFTSRDNIRRVIPLASPERSIIYASSIDPNALMIKRILDWLVLNRYL